MADDLATHRQWEESRDRIWAALFETLVRARLVIVDEELLDHRLQMASAEDEQVVQQLSPSGADEPFGDRVRPRGPIGQFQDLHALGAEDLIEAGGELAVAITEQEVGPERPVLELPGQVPSLLGHPLAGRAGRDAGG